jgi:TrpR-related protein YerC/YecD
MSTKKVTDEMINGLYEVIVSIKNAEDCRDLLLDLCTNKEVEQMAQRIAAAKLLMDGKTYTQVIEETDISSATLSRVSRCVQYGNGYIKFLK